MRNPWLLMGAVAAFCHPLLASETVVEDFTSVASIDPALTSAAVNPGLGNITLAPTRPRFGISFSSDGPDRTIPVPGFDVPQALVLVDLNNDGLDDLFYTTDDDNFYVIAQPGVALADIVPLVLPETFDDKDDIAVGDIDLDGDLDVFVAISDFSPNQPSYFYLNTGDIDAPFNINNKAPVGTSNDRTLDAEIADINGDRLPDLILGANDGGRYYLNNGTATPFSPAIGRQIGSSTSQVFQVLVADFNSDALDDVVLVRSSGQSRLHLNNGTVEPFTSASDGLPLGTSPDTGSGDIADLNNDGLIDIVLSRFGEDDLVFLNGGPETLFSQPQFFFDNNFSADSRRVTGDFNVDGVIDFMAASSNFQGNLYVSVNNGTGTSFVVEQSSGLLGAFRIRSFDFDNDTVADLLYGAGFDSDAIHVHLNKRDQNPYAVGPPPVQFGVPAGLTRDVAIFDVDNDGDSDVVAAYDGNNVLFLNQGVPLLNTAVNVTSDQDDTHALATADLNGDEFADIVAANNGLNRWYPNDLGDGPFQRASTGVPIGAETVMSSDVAAGDLNGDDVVDLVFANAGQNQVFYGGVPDQPFDATSVAVPLGAEALNTRGVIMADFDGDGDLDIATANDGVNTWYRNDGSSEPFGPASVALALGAESQTSNDLAAGDIDRDGLIDIVVANTGVNRWYRNTGDTVVFDPGLDGARLGLAAADSRSVSAGELVGGLEVVFANISGSPSHLFRLVLPTDQAAAREIDLESAATASSSVAAGDIDNDGAPDLVFGKILSLDEVIFGTAEASSLAPNAGFNLLANRVQSTALPGLSETVETVAVQPEDIVPGNTSIEYSVGTGPGRMQRVRPGRVLTLESPGPQLYWRARLSSLSPAITPTIEKITFLVNPVDSDADQIADSSDNCTLAVNPDQVDSDSDGFGNACDTDLNNDGITNFSDLEIFKQVFFGTTEAADFNGDGIVNFDDLTIMKDAFFGPPGPAGAL